MLDVKGSIVTIDAIGTQKNIAKTIIDNQANYILALKGNQIYLKEDVENLCKQMKPDSENEMVEKGHGRIETRNCKVYNQIQLLADIEKWSLRFLASHLRLSYGDQSARNDRFLLDHMGSGGGSPLASLHHYPPRTK